MVPKEWEFLVEFMNKIAIAVNVGVNGCTLCVIYMNFTLIALIINIEIE